jgi:formylglycine-generating enzyme required for sulfatase activity
MKCLFLLNAVVLATTFLAAADYTDQMATVPAGIFIMGDGAVWCGEDEREVTLTRDFYLGLHEVTNLEYLEAVQWAYDHRYVTATSSSVRDSLDGSTRVLLELDNIYSEIQFDGAGSFYLQQSTSPYAQVAYPGGYDPSDHPVKEVTWFGAVRYCDWLSLQEGLPRAYEHSGDWSCNGGDPYGAVGYRLPTDAEWEYAAQFDDERIYPWGNEPPDCSRANFDHTDYCVGWTSPAGSFPAAPEALELSDIAGNLYDWCNDWWLCNLGVLPEVDPTGPASGGGRVLRSSCWGDRYTNLPNAKRSGRSPGTGDYVAGFRVARTCGASDAASEPAADGCRLILDATQPNPFTESTRITYAIPDSLAGSIVNLSVFDHAGRFVCTLTDAERPPGLHTVTWNGTDAAGSPLAGGAYLYRLTVGGRTETKRGLLVR